MPKTKKPTKNFELKFTGKMDILIDLEDGSGPLEFRINSLDLTMQVVRILLAEKLGQMPVSSYDNRTKNKYKKILDGIE